MEAKNESVALLRETNAGIQMGVSTLEEIISDIGNEELRRMISEAKKEHDRLGAEAHRLLIEYGSDTKEPHPAAKAMSWVKTNVKMAVEPDDRTAAELVTDGCNMGIRSLHHYINEYKNADSKITELAFRVIKSEEDLCRRVSGYL